MSGAGSCPGMEGLEHNQCQPSCVQEGLKLPIDRLTCPRKMRSPMRGSCHKLTRTIVFNKVFQSLIYNDTHTSLEWRGGGGGGGGVHSTGK